MFFEFSDVAALAAVVVSIFALSYSKKTIIMNHRQEWIHKFRNEIANILALVLHSAAVKNLNSQEASSVIEKDYRDFFIHYYLVRLLLTNIENDKNEKNLIEKIDDLEMLFLKFFDYLLASNDDDSKKEEKKNEMLRELASKGQEVTEISITVIKKEWERVKDGK